LEWEVALIILRDILSGSWHSRTPHTPETMAKAIEARAAGGPSIRQSQSIRNWSGVWNGCDQLVKSVYYSDVPEPFLTCLSVGGLLMGPQQTREEWKQIKVPVQRRIQWGEQAGRVIGTGFDVVNKRVPITYNPILEDVLKNVVWMKPRQLQKGSKRKKFGPPKILNRKKEVEWGAACIGHSVKGIACTGRPCGGGIKGTSQGWISEMPELPQLHTLLEMNIITAEDLPPDHRDIWQDEERMHNIREKYKIWNAEQLGPLIHFKEKYSRPMETIQYIYDDRVKCEHPNIRVIRPMCKRCLKLWNDGRMTPETIMKAHGDKMVEGIPLI